MAVGSAAAAIAAGLAVAPPPGRRIVTVPGSVVGVTSRSPELASARAAGAGRVVVVTGSVPPSTGVAVASAPPPEAGLTKSAEIQKYEPAGDSTL